MSTVVVVRKNGVAAIAGDTLTSSDHQKLSAKYDRNSDKIYPINGSYIGFVGSSATQLVFENALRHLKKLRLESREHIFETLVHLHPILKEKYFLNPKDEEEYPFETSHIEALIAGPNGIFGVFFLRDVFEYPRFWAIGSGQDFALGAMYAVYDQLDSAEEIARIGVQAGCEFDKNSATPITLYTLQLREGAVKSA